MGRKNKNTLRVKQWRERNNEDSNKESDTNQTINEDASQELRRIKETQRKRIRRQDDIFRSTERQSDKVAKTRRRQVPEVRQRERLIDTRCKRTMRQNTQKRCTENLANKVAKTRRRQVPEVRQRKRLIDNRTKKSMRQNLQRKLRERQADKIAKREMRRQSFRKRLEKRQADQAAKTRRREDIEFRRLERQREKARKKQLRLEELYHYRENLIRTSRENTSLKLVHDFLISKNKGPDNICCCCDNLFFEKSVIVFDIQKLKENYAGSDFETFLSKICNAPSNLICSTCLSHVKKGRVPKTALSNQLEYPEIPPCLEALSPLEERMCAPYIPFMTIVPLLPYAVNPQLSLKGSVVNIPVEIDTMTKILPRKFDNMSTIQIKLKRHVDHRSDYMAETIRPAVVCEALKHLVTTPLYEKLGITLDASFLNAYEANENVQIDFIVEESDNTGNQRMNDEHESQVTDEDNDDLVVEGDEEVMLVDRNCEAAQQGNVAAEKNGTTVMAPGQGKTPVSWHNVEYLDELSFPKIYGGFPLDEDKKLSYAQRVKSECRRSDRRACVPRRILFMAKQKLERSVMGNVNVCLRKIKTNTKINAGLATSDSFISDAMRFDDGFRVLQQVRSSPAFWESKKKTLLALIRQIGFPTFFLTLSATEIKWPELIRILHKLAEGTEISLEAAMYMELSEKSMLVRNDPVTTVRYIDNIFHEIMKLLGDVNGPFAEHNVVDSFERREFQARGSVHTHNLLYCNKSPVYDKDRPESVTECCDFIDKFVVCTYDPTNPNMGFQRHKHTPTCSKGRKNKKSCRFNYPIPPMPRTTILEPLGKELTTETVKSNWIKIRNHINKYFDTNLEVPFEAMLTELDIAYEEYILAIRSSITRPKIFLKRTTLEVGINSYNPTILDILGSNMDIQFVLDPYSCASYMLNYVTKIDAGLSKLLREAATDVEEGYTSIRQRLRKVGNVFINSNVMGAQEAVYHVLGLPLTKCSRSSTFISTFPIDTRTRMLKSKSALESMHVDSEDVFVPNIFEKYSKRPASLENICLADYAAKYERSSTTANEVNEDNNDSNLKARKKDKILKYRRYKLVQNPTDYYREQLLMFSPWRDELSEIDQVQHEQQYTLKKSIIQENRKHYCVVGDEVIDEALENAFNEDLEIEEVDEFIENALRASQEVNLFPPEPTTNKPNDRGKFTFTVPPCARHEDLFNTLLTLNKEQRELVIHVYHCFKIGALPLRIYMSGSAGVGKSAVISTIFNLMSKYFEEKVGPKTDGMKILLAAPSGLAAFNIGGMTLHSAFALPVTEYGGQMPELSNDIANTIRAQLLDLQLLIIDEVSMVGGRVFQRVDTRLRQIMGKNQSFGGVSVILVGDLNQLPPVLDTPIYLPLKVNRLSILTDNVLWEEFRCFELVQIMRQRNDVAFITALNNLAAGTMTTEDVSLIKSREVREEDVPVEAIRLFSTNKTVADYNDAKIKNHPGEMYRCLAKDHISGKITEERKTKIREILSKKLPKETGGLTGELQFKIGIKYMMTSNVDISDGLVNGACGFLVHLSLNQSEEIETVWIDFGSEKVGRKARSLQAPVANVTPTATPIKRISTPITIAQKMDCQIIREQMPLVPAEALTIHKSQGQTYNHVCVDLRIKSRNSGTRALLYVALSRVTALSNLYILGSFTPPKPPKPNNPLAVELKRLKGEKQLTLCFSTNLKSNESCTIIYQNTRSLMKHFEHIKADNWYKQGDIIVFSETRTIPSDELVLPGYKVFHRSDGEFHVRSARGIMCFARDQLSPEILYSVQHNENKHHVDLIVLQCNGIVVITGYRNPSSPSSLFFSLLEQCLTRVHESCKLVLLGDFNWDAYNEDSDIASTLYGKYGLTRALLPQVPTTDFNTQIDIVFHKNLENMYSSNTYESYFSDHKPVYITISHGDRSAPSQCTNKSNISVPSIRIENTVKNRPEILSKQCSNNIENDNETSNSDNTYPRAMENLPGKNNCYVNSILQAVFQIDDFNSALRTVSCSSVLVNQLVKVLLDKRQPVQTVKVRECLANITGVSYFASCQQQDAAEFLQLLLSESLPHLNISELFNFHLTTVHSCQNCGYDSPSTSIDNILRGYFPTYSEGRVNFSKLFAPSETDLACPSCTSCCLKSTTIISTHCKYVIIQLVRFRNEAEQMIKITDIVDGFNPDHVDIFGVPYGCIGVVSHHGDSVFSGHYTANVRKNNNWVHCNDSDICSTSFDFFLKDAYILFLKKL
uniref:ATP-dependent DNA helicase n=1 Tax=Cacopsylla melanoneura TaxID=428564 RepID=A0A8D9E244_9HEMI